MSHLKTLTTTFALAFVMAGCAGTNFKRPEPAALKVGESKTADVTRVMGPPNKTGELLRNSQQLKRLTYVYATTGGTPLYPGVVPARALVFSTFNDTVVGQEFVSSFKDDASEFDETRLNTLVKGKSTRAEVTALLGKPTGEALYPIVRTQGESAMIYTYSHAKGSAFNMRFFSKTLTVSLNSADVVSDIEYASSGEK